MPAIELDVSSQPVLRVLTADRDASPVSSRPLGLDVAHSSSIRVGPLEYRHDVTFVEMVAEAVTPLYPETGEPYARRLVSELLVPPLKGTTLGRTVLAAYLRRELVGFSVITVKESGVAKVGPTVIAPSRRNQGLARVLRARAAQLVSGGGVHTLLTTCGADHDSNSRSLQHSGFRLVAALKDHYRVGVPELVWARPVASGAFLPGRLLGMPRGDTPRRAESSVELRYKVGGSVLISLPPALLLGRSRDDRLREVIDNAVRTSVGRSARRLYLRVHRDQAVHAVLGELGFEIESIPGGSFLPHLSYALTR